jgi:hypothetical protein
MEEARQRMEEEKLRKQAEIREGFRAENEARARNRSGRSRSDLVRIKREHAETQGLRVGGEGEGRKKRRKGEKVEIDLTVDSDGEVADNLFV